eukprot:3375995-Rhodomonas_salina.2
MQRASLMRNTLERRGIETRTRPAALSLPANIFLFIVVSRTRARSMRVVASNGSSYKSVYASNDTARGTCSLLTNAAFIPEPASSYPSSVPDMA